MASAASSTRSTTTCSNQNLNFGLQSCSSAYSRSSKPNSSRRGGYGTKLEYDNQNNN